METNRSKKRSPYPSIFKSDGNLLGYETQNFDGETVHLPFSKVNGEYAIYYDGRIPSGIFVMPTEDRFEIRREMSQMIKNPEIDIEEKVKIVGVLATLDCVVIDKNNNVRLPENLIEKAKLGQSRKVDVTSHYPHGYRIDDHDRNQEYREETMDNISNIMWRAYQASLKKS
jgi:hypothetical protein